MTGIDACPSPVELTREHAIGASEKTSDHLARCERCAAEWAAIERLAALTAQLPGIDLSAQRADDVRRSLLGAASSSASSRRPAVPAVAYVAAAAAALALALGGYLLLRAPVAETVESAEAAPPAEVFRAKVHAHAGAAHAIVGAQPDEIVRLTDGTVTLEVDPLAEGERFRVVVGDAVVEVRGTVFDVTAEDDRLIAVHVISGEVEVRPAEAPDAILTSGEWWRRPAGRGAPPDSRGEAPAVAAADAPESGAALPREPQTRARAPRPIGTTASATTIPAPAAAVLATPQHAEPVADDTRGATASSQAAFDEGWTALRRGDYATAARAFEVAAAGSDPIAEDAGYWLAVAHARAGRTARATHSLIAFLTRFPSSPRAGEASVMLGWKLLAAGDSVGAEARFRAAIDDPVARVRAGATRGLEAIGRGD